MAQVILEQVVKAYSDKEGAPVRAVHGIDLTVEDKEFMVLVGPSGCGKSTTLRMIAGLEEVTSGTIRIGGEVVNRVPPKERDIAMVFQNYALYPHMTVHENMAFGLKLRKFARSEIEARVGEAAAMLGLEELLQRKPKALSGGQRQRVALGRAIVRKPRVFLFDEPLSNLDAKMRVAMRMELARLRTRLQATVIYVTHDQVEAMTLGDRICVMRGGNILQVDPPLRLYHEPNDVFVGGFIGSPPMNFIRGKVVRESGGEGWRFVETAEKGTGVTLEVAAPPEAREGMEVVLGLRPEHIQLAGAAGGVRAKVEIFEPMGAEAFLHATAGGATFVARVAPEARCKLGSEVGLIFDVRKVHWFEASTGKALRWSALSPTR